MWLKQWNILSFSMKKFVQSSLMQTQRQKGTIKPVQVHFSPDPRAAGETKRQISSSHRRLFAWKSEWQISTTEALPHVKWCEENELSGRLFTGNPHHQLHGDSSVHHVLQYRKQEDQSALSIKAALLCRVGGGSSHQTRNTNSTGYPGFQSSPSDENKWRRKGSAVIPHDHLCRFGGGEHENDDAANMSLCTKSLLSATRPKHKNAKPT